VTGRVPPAELIEIADTITEIRPLKHAFDSGIMAQKAGGALSRDGGPRSWPGVVDGRNLILGGVRSGKSRLAERLAIARASGRLCGERACRGCRDDPADCRASRTSPARLGTH
jgi:hypothetical protein